MKKQRISKRSLQLYAQLRMLGYKIEELSPKYEEIYYGIELSENHAAFIHKRKAKFSVEDNDLGLDEPFIIHTSKITDESLDIILNTIL